MDAVAVLKDMLEDGAPNRVYDIFDPSCLSLYAACPSEWLRGVLARDDVKVVLLQTPAAAALYGAQQDDDTLHLVSPLLGSVVQYRRPHFGDALLQLALRLVRDAAHAHPEYTKYYIATISELDSDMMPQVAPYRRYVLPAHAPLLLSDLRLRVRTDGDRLDQLAPAIRKLQDYVRANENYLRDELMFL
ncbi:uncharacterized protein [Choristoneura fumiferana]|uniref:uncharacterized protein n=1 Tax=Choristoneura fumiferana TaxID=7141 RepID=UPI003D15EB4F